MPNFQWSRLDDLILFLAWAAVACVFLWAENTAIASSLISSWGGAVAMYLRNNNGGQ